MDKTLDVFSDTGWQQVMCHKHLIQRDLIVNNTILIEVFTKVNPATIGDSVVVRKLDLVKSKVSHFSSKIYGIEQGKLIY